MYKHFLAAAFALASLAASAAQAGDFSGYVHAFNTIDYVSRDSVPGETVELTVSASGVGNNKLKVEVQFYNWPTTSWVTMERMYVTPGTSSTLSYAVPNGPYVEVIRYRLSRKIGTSRIDYTGDEH